MEYPFFWSHFNFSKICWRLSC